MVVRKAVMQDIGALLRLINDYAANGVMLPRTEFELAEHIRDFHVVENEGLISGCGALHFYTPTSGEVRSLAVQPDKNGAGLGTRIVRSLEAEARESGLDVLFAFTYVPGFFQKAGFHEVDRSLLPLKAWKDCLRCPKFQCCDEIAVVKILSGEALDSLARERDRFVEPELVQLPVIPQQSKLVTPESLIRPIE